MIAECAKKSIPSLCFFFAVLLLGLRVNLHVLAHLRVQLLSSLGGSIVVVVASTAATR